MKLDNRLGMRPAKNFVGKEFQGLPMKERIGRKERFSPTCASQAPAHKELSVPVFDSWTRTDVLISYIVRW